MPTQTHPLAFLLAFLADLSLSVAMPVSTLIFWRVAIGPLGIVESVICVVVGLVGYVFARGVVLPRRLFVSREVDDAPKRPPPP
ncbi:hypothetical protein C474_09407 [Halogeometricum pallidum JCM 14848]|uniref:Uncharacterized protein n=1 Tax=Halogeometricum pallidum JCM 14848 TaxID=1227487 RepID=M0D9Y4_HALPD|nr:hypothetical protein [Halogeometricum pallidum]ELZ31507.1 hypothetical protein C474_09407 [Halogeometricum pallidum JCM 14848]